MPLSTFISTATSDQTAQSWTQGIVMGLLANIAYDTDEANRRARFEAIGTPEVFSFDCSPVGITGLNAYVLRHRRDLIVAVRGSQEAVDWFTNARLGKTRIDNVLVHDGFAASARRFMSVFNDKLSLFGDFEKIWLTGHSLGGAVAQVAGYLLHRQGNEIANVTSFGAPRVGGPVLWRRKVKRANLHAKYVRWVNHRDTVPRIPVVGLRPQNWAWVHVGRLHYIDTAKQTVRLDDPALIWPTGRTSRGFDDHSMSGFAMDDESGYLRNMMRFMPAAYMNALAAEMETQMTVALSAFSRTQGASIRVQSLSTINQTLHQNLSLAQVGLAYA